MSRGELRLRRHSQRSSPGREGCSETGKVDSRPCLHGPLNGGQSDAISALATAVASLRAELRRCLARWAIATSIIAKNRLVPILDFGFPGDYSGRRKRPPWTAFARM